MPHDLHQSQADASATSYRPTVALATLSAMLMTMSACQHIPQKQQPIASIPVQLADYQQLTDATALIGANNENNENTPSIASQRWQTFYNQPKLKQLISRALQHNADAKAATLAIQKAQAQYQITEASGAVQIGASAQATRGGDFAGSSTKSYQVGLALSGYEVDFWGRVANLKAAALANFLATKQAKEAVQVSLISQVAQTWLAISYNQAQLALAQKTLKAQQKTLTLNQQRYDAGIDAKLSVTQAKTAVAAARLSIANYKTAITQSNNALRYLLGEPVPKQLLPTGKITQLTTTKLFSAGLPSELLLYRPDLRMAEQNIKAAGANVSVARASFFPTIRLAGSVGTASSQLNKLFSSGSFAWSITPSVSLPLFDAGALQANHEVAVIEQQQAVVSYKKAIETAFREVADVFAERETIDERIKAQTMLLNASKESYRIAKARFDAGIANYLSVIDAQRTVFASEQALLNLQQLRLLSQIQLYQRLGGGAELTSVGLDSEK